MSEEEAVKKRWYVVQAYSQYESRVKKTLLEYIKMHNMEDYFGQVLVPTEEVVEMRAGQKRKRHGSLSVNSSPGAMYNGRNGDDRRVMALSAKAYLAYLVSSVAHLIALCQSRRKKQTLS